MTRLQKISSQLKALLKPDDTLVFVHGNFNVLHPGHVRLLQFAKSNGTVLVVAVSHEGAPGTSIDAETRLASVRSIGIVDHAFILEEAVTEAIAVLKPGVVAKGKEHESHDNEELAAVQAYGGRLLFNSGEMRFSDLSAIDRQYAGTAEDRFVLDPAFLKRHGYGHADARALLGKFGQLKVAVIGDLIIDEYVDCEPLGMSQEDPTIVVRPLSQRRFVGGAGIVAAHCAGLGAKVDLFSVAGKDEHLHFATQRLSEYGVAAQLLADPSRPTTHKKRYRALNKTLLRVSELGQHDIERRLQDEIFERLSALMPGLDVILFSDFNYGCLPTELVERIVPVAKRHGVKLAADSQASSQQSDISRFRGMDVITPTEREARMALKDSASGLVELAEKLRIASDAGNVLVTLASEGVLIHAPSYGSFRTDRLPAMNSRPQDVAGAGDSLFSCAALGLSAGADIWLSSYLGSAAAACQVSRVGNAPLSAVEILEVLA